ncbi:alpha/beta hydrolase-fold protein [Demequina sp. NBRC 110053]|uniref:alpha/beta hydrolase-fold protein n=1 Tax=Demequina sp. NBRC 110053 TaxID=1570342 RepID=UPI001EECA752|nr:alpha/beta hydrolase-fold protein [Demequina sp. NBRC 110053]
MAATAMATTAIVAAAQPALAEDEPWVEVTDGGYVSFDVPREYMEDEFGEVGQVVAEGNFGPGANWAELGLPGGSGGWTGTMGPLEPGLYYYQITADDFNTVKDPTNPTSVESEPEWSTFFVPGEGAELLADVPDNQGGEVTTLTYDSTVAGEERSALVWTPPDYDEARADPYPVLYLNHGGGQSYRDWVEVGRAKQILDNLALEGRIEPMVVVMPNGNVSDYEAELLENVIPAARAGYHISSEDSHEALAGLSLGGLRTLSTLLGNPGEFSHIGSFAGFLFGGIGDADAQAINDGTDLLRIYTGNKTDVAYNATVNVMDTFDAAGVEYEFDGVNPDHGHNWDAWQEALIDFAPRLFQDVDDHGMSEGHLALEEEFDLPAPGTTPTPWITDDGFVTFETTTEFADAEHVTVWGNWGPGNHWVRLELNKAGDRWRGTFGPLEPGAYHYRLIVDRQAVKDESNPTWVRSEPTWSTFYVAGDTTRGTYLGDVPEGEGGEVSEMTYDSTEAGEERTSLVWTPPNYDADREQPYPVLYLQHGGGQTYSDWIQVGRAKQILDNHYLKGDLEPMVVVMSNGNGVDFPTELLENIVPAAESQYNVSDDPDRRALAGLSMGGGQTLDTVFSHPGEFAYVGSFSAGFFGGMPDVDVDEFNEGTTLLRLYNGDFTDFTYNSVLNAITTFDEIGIDYEFPGFGIGPHGWNVWQDALIDFVPRLFRGEDAEGIELRATVEEAAPGALAMTIADYGDAVELVDAGNAGDRLRFEGDLPTVVVTDSRNDRQARGGGWAVSGQVSAFTADEEVLGGEHLGWTPRVKTPRPGLERGDRVRTVLSNGPGLATPARLAEASAEGRFGSASLGADLVLEAPVGTAAGEYSGTMTVSLFPVD